MRTLLEIADHLERLATQVGDDETARHIRKIAHDCIECIEPEDTYWVSLRDCISQLTLNPKMSAMKHELMQLAYSCSLEAGRVAVAA